MLAIAPNKTDTIESDETPLECYVAQLEGFVLDCYVSQIVGKDGMISSITKTCTIEARRPGNVIEFIAYQPSECWIQGGPLIEHFSIGIKMVGTCQSVPVWEATSSNEKIVQYGSTALTAAMRCIVAMHYGDKFNPSKHIIMEFP